jgi:excisionase family DNA binding protein
VYTSDEASEILGVSDRTIQRMVQDGRIQRINGLRNIRISAEELEKFIRGYNPNGGTNGLAISRGVVKCVSQSKETESINAGTHNIGGLLTATEAARKLNDLLGLPTDRKH